MVKEFDIGDCGTNYLFTAKIRLENTSSNSLQIPRREVVVGTATAIGPLDDPTTLGVIWYNGDKSAEIGAGWFANRTLGCIPGTPRSEFEDGASNVVWAAMHSQYFALAAIPAQPAPGVVIRNLKLPPPGHQRRWPPAQRLTLTNRYEGYQTAFVYPATASGAAPVRWNNPSPFTRVPRNTTAWSKLAIPWETTWTWSWASPAFWGFLPSAPSSCSFAMNGLHDHRACPTACPSSPSP